ncbi:SprB repeat-containing protein [Flavobacterium chilense]|uniref:Uncharacterized protein n=1 Tax=Flavobacterium chilense TaxID=946677 RepID=A0A1M7CMS2_9FLAO|nr:SprB repeat-containing protein [Flavobacterium chilense]SHL68588.1 hypothetical protein SAMN05444484_102223 [Flavobacterium chilense]
MKNLRLFMISFVALTIFSCSQENIKQNDETAVAKSSGITKKTATEDCGTPKEFVLPADNLYNCHGLSFILSEKVAETKQRIEDPVTTLYELYFKSEIFKEDNSSNATKVLYWNDYDDYLANNFRAVDHSAMIIGNDIVYSKEGSNPLYKNCIQHCYLTDITGKEHYLKKYSLNLDLNPYEINPVRKVPFTVSVAHDASALLDVQYDWVSETADYNYVQITKTGGSCSIKFNGNAPKKLYTFTLKAKHQRGKINNVSFEKDLTKTFTIDLKGNPDPTASFTGSNYVTQSSMGSWTATASGGTAPYQYYWWIKRQQDPDSFYLQIATGSPIYLFTRTSVKSTYYTMYLRVVDANGQSFSTQPQVIQSTGPLELFDL